MMPFNSFVNSSVLEADAPDGRKLNIKIVP
jgi:hypothetical protein